MRLLSATLVVLAVFGSAVCGEPGSSSIPSTGTDRMRLRLAEMRDSLGINENPYGNSARVRALRAYGEPAEPERALAYLMTLGRELVYAGRYDEAIEALTAVTEHPEFRGRPARSRREVLEYLSVSYLSLVLDNPCAKVGVGAQCVSGCPAVEPPAGAAAAARRYAGLVEDAPDDLTTRWLANLAFRAAAVPSDSIPAALRLPALESGLQGEISRFWDVAPCLGLDVLGHAGGVVLDDLDNDGDLDLLTSSTGFSDPLRLFRNLGDGTFREDSKGAGLEGLFGGLNLVQADYDNDGDIDVFVLRGAWFPSGHPNSLLQNQGDGTFLDVTEEAGLLTTHPTQTAAWGDFDNDGSLDLFIGNETRGAGAAHPSELFHNNGDGTFSDVSSEAGVALTGFVKAVVWGDYDGDGRLDLFVSCFEEPNRLFRGEGPGPDGGWHFRDVTSEAGLDEPRSSFPAWFWDFDNDGRLDVLVFGYRLVPQDVVADALALPHEGVSPRLYSNRGDGTFTDRTAEVGLDRIVYAMGSNFGDLDNDGWLDVFAGTGDPDPRAIYPNRVFRSDRGRLFEEVTRAGGFGNLGKGHGVAFGDIDGDGDQDVYVVIGGAFEGDLGRNALYLNPGGDNGWITLRLEGVRANRSAIGARVRLELETPRVPREVHVVVGSGGSFGASSLQQEIGLGDATRINLVEIRWPGSGHVDTYHDLPIRRILYIREGAQAPIVVESAVIDIAPSRREP